MKPHISLITLGVKNLQKSTQFYQSIGFPTETTGDITFIKMASVWLALYPLDELASDAGVANDKQGFAGMTLAHNVVSKEQVDQVFAELKQRKVTISDEPHQREWGGYSGYFADPDGYLWEVAFNPFAPQIAVNES
jgi:uncharacterized protein